MPSKKSGGKRAVEKKHRERAAARERAAGGRDAGKVWLRKVSALGAPPKTAEKAHTWLGRAALLLVQATLKDVALPPEQMRRDAMRQIEQASKVLDPAKLSEQLEELERARQELVNAREVQTGEDRQSSPGVDLI